MLFFRRKRQPSNDTGPKPRPPLSGEIHLANRTWTVREEKRQGPRPQILILTATDDPACEIHVRPDPGQEAKELANVEPLARDPSHRWFCDNDGQRWEARIVQTERMVQLVKFICWGVGVFEGPYPYKSGLGTLSDDQLRRTLGDLRNVPS